ncbi:MAG: hypothetical protein V2I40_12175 [Desulfobacteraceae bacterium]|jgi:class 3 adenylate cyclase|nr:hypothetical protein [Desulfobacteraceae bacterium]
MLGDTVNLAARLQVPNQKLAADMLFSGETCDRLAVPDISFQPTGPHAVKGKTEPVVVHAVAKNKAKMKGNRW